MKHLPVVVVRYSEIGLKGGNRRDFEKLLVRNLKHVLKDLPHGPVERPRGRVVVRDPGDPAALARAAASVFGVASVSPALSTEQTIDEIVDASRVVLGDFMAENPGDSLLPFRVSGRRSEKRFPLNSMELERLLGGKMLPLFPRLKVDLSRPEVVLGVEVREKEALVFCRQIEGPGGLPVGSQGTAVALLSGGIDSPVAAWMTMKRGTRVIFMNYHSYPFISEASRTKVEKIARSLGRFQRGTLLVIAPFAPIQVAIKKECPEQLRTILYRRMMIRLAERLAEREGALALVTGESLGQVASQTLENIRAIGEAAALPLLRPLIGFDKSETIDLARRIGTYDISIEPYPDCCTVFQPRKPKIKATLEEVERAEEALDIEGLVDESFSSLDEERF